MNGFSRNPKKLSYVVVGLVIYHEGLGPYQHRSQPAADRGLEGLHVRKPTAGYGSNSRDFFRWPGWSTLLIRIRHAMKMERETVAGKGDGNGLRLGPAQRKSSVG